MKLNAIGLTTACSLLCVAFCQPIVARTIRADNGTPANPNDWNAGSPSTIGGLSLNSGLSNYVLNTYLPSPSSLSGLQDAFNESGGLAITGGTMYNYWSSNQAYLNSPQSPQDQIMLYTLDNNTGNLSFNPNSYSSLAGNPSLSGDIEIDFNYSDSVSNASFKFGGVTYTAPASSTPNANFLFSSIFTFLGFLNDSATAANVSFTPNQGSKTLDGWTVSGGAAAAPEIDPSSIVTALTLLAGALVVVRGNTRSRLRVVANG